MEARAEITDFRAMVFNPSSMDRLIHVVIAAFLAGAFLVLSVNAFYILKNRFTETAKAGFKIALVFATFSSLLQVLSGDRSAKVVAKYQPAKLASFEGHYDSLARADMYLFGFTDAERQKTKGVSIPGGLSFLLSGNFSEPVKGLNAVAENDRPGPKEVAFVFQTYHIMIALGVMMIALTLFASLLWWRKKIFNYRWLMIMFVFSVLMPQMANQVGWYSAEVGRQPWIVYGLLRTSEGLTRSLHEGEILFSLILFSLVYCALFLLFIYMMNKKIQHGYHDEEVAEASSSSVRKVAVVNPSK